MRRKTIAEVAESMNVSPENARGLVKILVEKQIIMPAGMRPRTTGRAPEVFEFPDGFEDRFVEILKDADLTS